MPEAEPVIIATGWEVEEDMVAGMGNLALITMIEDRL